MAKPRKKQKQSNIFEYFTIFTVTSLQEKWHGLLKKGAGSALGSKPVA